MDSSPRIISNVNASRACKLAVKLVENNNDYLLFISMKESRKQLVDKNFKKSSPIELYDRICLDFPENLADLINSIYRCSQTMKLKYIIIHGYLKLVEFLTIRSVMSMINVLADNTPQETVLYLVDDVNENMRLISESTDRSISLYELLESAGHYEEIDEYIT